MGTQIRAPGLALAIGLLLAAACGGSAGGPNSTDPSVDVQLTVQQTLPSNGQECQPDLRDAGEEQDAGFITVRFSETVDPDCILDPANAMNGLTADVNILRSDMTRVSGTPTITGVRGNLLQFRPSGGTLDNGQYTVTVTRDVQGAHGACLNRGLWDYRSSFTIGSDTYNPVIRGTYPAPNQKGVCKESTISVMFNESLNPASVNSGSFIVADGGTNPPTVVAGKIETSHDDFEILFTPDPLNPLPPNATIVVTVIGGVSGVTDRVGNPFTGDPATPNRWEFQFETVTEPPLPRNPYTIDTFTGFWTNAGIYYGTDRSIGVIDEAPYLQNLQDLTLWGSGNPVPNSETQLSVDGHPGRIGEILVDPRFNPGDGHSWIYVTDLENGALHIVGSRDSRIVHTWTDLPDPTGLAIRPDGTRLYVTNASNDTMSALDIGQAAVGTRGVNDVVKGLSKPNSRVDVPVGHGPSGVAHAPDGNWIVVANTLDSTVSAIDSATLQVKDVLHVGGNPTDVAMTWFYVSPPYQIGRFAYVTCKGSGPNDGTIAFLWLSALSIPPLVTPSGHWQVQATLTDFGSPEGIAFDYGRAAWFADSAADEVVKISWEFQGIAIISPMPILQSRVPVGHNPTDVALEPWVYYRTNGQVLPYVVIAACRGSGELRFIDNNQPARPQFTMKIPKVEDVASILDQ